MTCDVGEVKRAEDLNTHQGTIFDYLPSKLAGIYPAAVASVKKDHYKDLTLRLFQGNTANTEKLPKKKKHQKPRHISAKQEKVPLSKDTPVAVFEPSL